MKEERYHIALDKYDKNIVINALNNLRNRQIQEERPTEPVDGLIDGLEIVLDVHTELTFGKVAQVAHTGLDLVLPAQIFSDGFRLGRRLDDHQMLFCHEYYSSSSVTVKEKCLPPLCST